MSVYRGVGTAPKYRWACAYDVACAFSKQVMEKYGLALRTKERVSISPYGEYAVHGAPKPFRAYYDGDVVVASGPEVFIVWNQTTGFTPDFEKLVVKV